MSKQIKVLKVKALPTKVIPSAIYLVHKPKGLMELHVSSVDGKSTNHILLESEINAMIQTALMESDLGNILVSQTIAERDKLKTKLKKNTLVLVIDATTDPTVNKGAALYVYAIDTKTFTKVAEFESMDLVFDWTNLKDKPSSPVKDIDDAVAKKHSHGNSNTLDELGVKDHKLTFNNKPVCETNIGFYTGTEVATRLSEVNMAMVSISTKDGKFEVEFPKLGFKAPPVTMFSNTDGYRINVKEITKTKLVGTLERIVINQVEENTELGYVLTGGSFTVMLVG